MAPIATASPLDHDRAPVLSLVIPVRNGEPFIAATLAEICASDSSFEVIVVDDGSTDCTRQTVAGWASRDARVRLLSNPGSGKVQALNAGYAGAQGRVIKCVDADDILVRGYIDHLVAAGPGSDEAECHDMHLTDRDLRPIGCYRAHPLVVNGDRRRAIEQLSSLPRPSWSFGRAIAERIFPMPDDLPFEDVWFAVMAKRFASRVRHHQGFCYQYRQHGNQTFGGILNHSPEKVAFRAGRMLRLIDVLVREAARLEPAGLEFDAGFTAQRRYWELLGQARVSLGDILGAPLPLAIKAKLLLFRRVPWAIPRILRCKYGLDAVRLALAPRPLVAAPRPIAAEVA